ncbi:NADH:flavin oxidoreductase [Salinibius halmophilus]|uniref:NADH:flavin oxidoreductase n=1 Tax=Salinibius halmophilus TaxID=1853216 RepID=UPI000E6604D9|nr:NADH:flavin oxidoreductase [Salinibius halmophilus]
MLDFSKPISFSKPMPNAFALAPMTNQQSHPDGTLSDDELNWLSMRAKGGFGMVMTCAAHVSENGQGWPGAMGVFGDQHISGLSKLAKAITDEGSLAIVQLFHGGIRAPEALIGQQPVSASDHAETNARALTTEEVQGLVQDFIAAAVRCQKAGMSGVELHGAHGYLICQFLSQEYNQRTDQYGGSFDNRTRFLREIIDGIDEACSDDFVVGVRLSPERMGLDFNEMRTLATQLMASGKIDFLDVSLWDSLKYPEDPAYQNKTLLEWYAELPRHNTKLCVAGNIRTGEDVSKVMAAGVDFVAIGRAGILHHDFAKQVTENPDFTPRQTPVSRRVLAEEGLGEAFIDYMSRWPGFVEGAE